MKKNLLLIDLSNLMYKYLYIYGNLSVKVKKGDRITNKPTGHIYGCINVINYIARHNPDTDIILAIDGISPRKAINTEYKDRKEYNDDYSVGENTEGRYNVHKDAPMIIKLLSFIPNIHYIYNKNLEADDMIHGYISENRTNYEHVGIMSEDKDLLINIEDPKIFQFNKIKYSYSIWDNMKEHDFWDIDKVKNNFFGLLGKELIFYKSMIGDSSDNIKGYYRFQKKVAGIVVKTMKLVYPNEIDYNYESSTVDDMELYYKIDSEHLNAVLEESGIKKTNFNKHLGMILDDMRTMIRNVELIRPYKVDNIKKSKIPSEEKELREIAKKYKLNSYVQNVLNWKYFDEE